MLAPARLLLASAVLFAGSVALAEDEPRAIFEPLRLTAGPSGELMGSLSRDESSLYFVSDASATLDLMIQSPIDSGPKALSSGLGDIAWPEVAPDGKHIAYISFERDSTGDVCLRSLRGGSAGDEKCLTGADSAELQVLWWDERTLAVLSRRDLHGDYRLRKVPIGGGTATTIVARNMVGLTLSPNRKWLAYIPVEKRASGVGVTFSNRTAVGVHLHRLGSKKKPVVYTPPLPGVTGYLAFSADGKHLYFSQYLNDTNRDGVIDGDDNGVIFRLGWNESRGAPSDEEPRQLTSARWDCHYPSPGKTSLIITCSHNGSLDVYALPHDGAVPSSWNDSRIAGEIAVARDLWTQLILSSRRLGLAKVAGVKEAILRDIMGLHLELREYEAAIYYAEKRAGSSQTLNWADVISDLARHRRADLALIRGQLSQQYIKSERARAQKLRERRKKAPTEVADLALLVISEIEDDIGEKTASLATFRQLKIDQLTERHLAPLVAARAQRLYRLRGDREGLLDVYRTLAGLTLLDTGKRLRYAQSFVSELGRGKSLVRRRDAIDSWRSKVDQEGELALLLDVERALLDLDDASEEEVRKALFALYKKNKDLDRRRALVLATLQASAKVGNEYMQYQFATSWASWLKRAHPERKYAETIYNNIVLDRAYGEGSQGEIGESRGYFYGTTISTQSLEGHIGFIEARIAEGKGSKVADLDEVYRKRFEREPDSPVYAFVKAYRLARELPLEKDLKLHEQDVEKVLGLLRGVAKVKPKEAQVHQLWGYALHQRARRNGSREAAVSANRQYLLALDLAGGDPRLEASLLHRLGLLQASLGNHRLALKYLLRRDRLPHVRPLAELGLRLAIARSAWHADEVVVAKEQMLAAQALIERAPSLKRFLPLVLDRLALSLSAAGDAAAARIRYNELADLQDATPSSTAKNRLKASIGLAVTAIESGEADKAVSALKEADRVLESNKELDPPPKVVWRESLTDSYSYTRLQYQALVTGLLVRAYRQAGDDKGAVKAVLRRISLLEDRLKKSRADEDRIALAQAFHQLSELKYRLNDTSAARAAIEAGLTLSAAYNKNTGSGVNNAGLALIQAYAELHLYGGVAKKSLKLDLGAELSRAYSFICKYRSPRWARQRFLFEIYLTMLSLGEDRTTERNP